MTAEMAEPQVVGCTCDFSGGTRGMDRCGRCAGTGSRFLVVTNGNPFYFPNTRRGYEDACRTLGVEPEPQSADT